MTEIKELQERAPTGIPGLDALIEGGFPRGRTILVTGPCGSGKTIICIQFLYNGAFEYAEPGIFVTFDERPDVIRKDMSRFGWDLRSLESDGLFAFIDGFSRRAGVPSKEKYVTRMETDELLHTLWRVTEEIGAERIGVDSLTSLQLSLETEFQVRRDILKLTAVLSSIETTSLLTAELQATQRITIEEFMSEGVIILTYGEKAGRLERSLLIQKMRGTNHSLERRPFAITERGLEVFPQEIVYEM